jgi:uncharacterized DUF497 family protein
MSEVVFDWDERKAASNLAKHGVSFETAITAFDDPFGLYQVDTEHSDEELRERLIGRSDDGVLVVIFVILEKRHGEVTRIISARKATRKEKVNYEKAER